MHILLQQNDSVLPLNAISFNVSNGGLLIVIQGVLMDGWFLSIWRMMMLFLLMLLLRLMINYAAGGHSS